MAIKDFNSLECIKCGVYNLQTDNAIILTGECYCLSCFVKSSDLQNKLEEMIFEEKK